MPIYNYLGAIQKKIFLKLSPIVIKFIYTLNITFNLPIF